MWKWTSWMVGACFFALTLFSATCARADAKPPSLEAAVVVTVPESGVDADHVFEAAKATLKEKGYAVHDPKRIGSILDSVVGTVSAIMYGQDPSDAMRDKLGVDLLVFIQVQLAGDGKLQLRVAWVSRAGVRAKTSDVTTEQLDARIDGMLTAAIDEAPRDAMPAHPQEGKRARAAHGGVGLEVGGRLEEAEAKRQAWLKRGGGIVSYELKAIAVGMLMPETSIPCIAPAGSLPRPGCYGIGQGGGGGGGAGFRIAYVHLSLPDPTTDTNSWFAFRLGTGLDASYFAFRQPVGWDASQSQAVYIDTSLASFSFPLQIGVQIGLGGFGSGTHWRGLVLGLNYAPSYTYSKPKDGDGSGTFNPAGFEVTFDVASLEATIQKYATEAHFRISVFILPPVTPETPLLGSLGLGAVWY